MPAVKSESPSNDFFVNFSFKTKNEKSIVRSIDNFPIEFTATGFAPT